MEKVSSQHLPKFLIVAAVSWTAVVFGFLAWNIIKIKDFTEQAAKREARTNFKKDQSFRLWGALHGGVYVPAGEATAPNPYLVHVEERDITTPSGKKLTLMNPAYMVRQMNEHFKDMYGIAGHLTSLKLLNPDNKPDEWERKALLSFEKGVKEVIEFTDIDGEPYLRLMQPLPVVKGCLKCHGHQGYKVGDIRGGINISLPLADLKAKEHGEILVVALSHSLIWLIGIIGIGVGSSRINKYVAAIEQSERALRESERSLRNAQEIARLGHWRLDPATGSVEGSDELFRIFGLGKNEGTLENFGQAVHPNDRAYDMGKIQRGIEHGEPWDIEHRLLMKDGSVKWVHAIGEPILDENGKTDHILGAVQDITERKKSEFELNRLFTAIEQAAETIVITDENGAIQYANPAFEKISGYSRSGAVGENPRILKSGKHDEKFYKEMWDTLTGGKVWTGRFINRKKSGKLFEEEATISPITDSAGTIVGYVAVKRDVTEEVAMQQQIRQSQKMDAMGTLAGGIAHDFNNILTGIMGFTEIAIEDIPDGSDARSHLDEAMNGCKRAKELIKQILTFSRREKQELYPMQSSQVVEESVNLIRATLPATIEIITSITKNSGVILAEPTLMTQVIMNLCTNAGYAMRDDGGTLEVSLAPVDIDEEAAPLYSDIEAGPYVRISVSDTGHGMDEQTRDRIFEPFFTTKPKGEGTGMGLSVVHGIIGAHNGSMTVYSEVGSGTTINVLLPRIETEAADEEKTAAPLARGAERILFVDDEESIIKVSKIMLERLGYDVIASSSSVKALDIFTSSPSAFDLVVTDHTMPGMTGMELARKIWDINPAIPVVLCTGYSHKLNEDKAKEMGIKEFIHKPITRQTLVEAIRRALDT